MRQENKIYLITTTYKIYIDIYLKLNGNYTLRLLLDFETTHKNKII